MKLSLIKCATNPDPEQDKCEHFFTYSLLPHRGDFISGKVEQEATDLNLESIVHRGITEEISLLKLDNENIIVDAMKKAEDSDEIIVRLHEFSGGRQTINLKFDFKLTNWVEVDLMERPIGERNTKEVTLAFKPYEIKTIMLKP